jgi:hypothetical protein
MNTIRIMTSLARTLDEAGLSDIIEMMLRTSQVSGSEYATTDAGGVQGLEATLRQKPVKPFIGDGFEMEDLKKEPEKPFRKKRPRSGGYEVGKQVALHYKPEIPRKEIA